MLVGHAVLLCLATHLHVGYRGLVSRAHHEPWKAMGNIMENVMRMTYLRGVFTWYL
jgi:hypothetical protein